MYSLRSIRLSEALRFLGSISWDVSSLHNYMNYIELQCYNEYV
jgi:hypothetical protein